MGGRQSSSSMSNTSSATGSSAVLAQGERNSPQRRVLGATSSTATSSRLSGSAFDTAGLNVEISQDAANILQRLSLANANRYRTRSSLSTTSASNHSAANAARRTRSRTSVGSSGHARAVSGNDDVHEAFSSESDDNEEEDDDAEEEERNTSSHRAVHSARSNRRMPFRFGFFPVNGIKCPICKQTQQPSDFELHLVMCLTKPRVTYNEDVLTADKDEECAICLEDLKEGNCIARLPCLCIFHKKCVDDWFNVRQTCPNHPGD